MRAVYDDTRITTDATTPVDDPGWDLPTVLVLDDGSQVELPEVPMRDARAFLSLALDTGAWIGGLVDPRRVRAMGPRE